jgi:PhnB protein
MSDEPSVRVALRVSDVAGAAALYQSFGFVPVGTVPGAQGGVVMAILRRGPLQLLVDALVGIPFPDSPRERRTRTGPRGLGVVIGLEVDDVDEAARNCRAAGCVIHADPRNAPWGERYVECEDPYGYAWKFFRVTDSSDDGLQAVQDAWSAARTLSPAPQDSARPGT